MKEKVDKLYFIKIIYSVFRKVLLRLEKLYVKSKGSSSTSSSGSVSWY